MIYTFIMTTLFPMIGWFLICLLLSYIFFAIIERARAMDGINPPRRF